MRRFFARDDRAVNSEADAAAQAPHFMRNR
jgi:hypothetical protein